MPRKLKFYMSFGLFQLCSSISKRLLSGAKTSSLLGIFEGFELSHPTHSVPVAILPFLGIQLLNFFTLDSGKSLKNSCMAMCILNMHVSSLSCSSKVMGHRRRQTNLQQRVNSAKRKSNNELRNAISAMQLQLQVVEPA